MDEHGRMDAEELIRRMRADFEKTMQTVAQVVNEAPDGHWIDGSEERVRDVLGEFRCKAYQQAMQLRIEAAETSAAFSPSKGGRAASRDAAISARRWCGVIAAGFRGSAMGSFIAGSLRMCRQRPSPGDWHAVGLGYRCLSLCYLPDASSKWRWGPVRTGLLTGQGVFTRESESSGCCSWVAGADRSPRRQNPGRCETGPGRKKNPPVSRRTGGCRWHRG